MQKMRVFVSLLSLVLSINSYSKIMDKNNKPKWKEIVTAPPQIKKNGALVAFLIIRKWDKRKGDFARKKNGRFKVKRCTGFLVAPQIIMTNWHCIKNPKQTVGLTASFKYEMGIPRKQRKKVICETFLNHYKYLDFALVKCEKMPFVMNGVAIDNRPYNVINGKPKKKDRPMYLVHQQCKGKRCTPYKRYQIERIRETGVKSAVHEADSLSGTSGSPLFDKHSHRLIALHYEGNSTLNQAVPIYKIINYMKKKSQKGNAFYKDLLGKMKLTVP